MNDRRWEKFESKIGSMKFAVGIIMVFAVLMIIGTFVESYYGTEFAGRVLYKKWPFMAIQFFMFLSILFAMFRRYPFKKRLSGFYIIHIGLITLGAGSFITWYAGVDGSIHLPPNSPNRQIVLPTDEFVIHYREDGKIVRYQLPDAAFSTSIDQSYGDIKLKEYLPYAEDVVTWESSKTKGKGSATYQIFNDNMAQDFTVSLNPDASEYQSSMKMGPLSVQYLPETMRDCFNKKGESQIFFWNRVDDSCFTPEEKKIKIEKTKTGQRVVLLKTDKAEMIFLPDRSPIPLTKELKFSPDAPIRVLNKKMFMESPYLFLFGESIAYYDKNEEKWMQKSFTNNEKIIELPWMGFKLNLIKHELNKTPIKKPRYITPIQKNGQLIKGGERAVKIEVKGESYWVKSFKPLSLLIDGKQVFFRLDKKALTLPFEFVLDRFKMDKDPGTNSPASYESFVRVFTAEGTQKAHIYMNNPLKYEGFTFYQASYSQDEQGRYSSTLSANRDPGRPFKYLGSLLLVLGAMLHFNINILKNKSRTTYA